MFGSPESQCIIEVWLIPEGYIKMAISERKNQPEAMGCLELWFEAALEEAPDL